MMSEQPSGSASKTGQPRHQFGHQRGLASGVLIAPSILSADFAAMGDDARGVLDAGADLLHLDVMDGHFVPNLTMGPDMVQGLRRALPDAHLDAHLMVTDPDQFVEPFARAGADHFTFHIETRSGDDARGLADRIRDAGMTAGLAINPPTDPEQFLAVADAFDLLLVMSVNPGFSGQAFIPDVLSTVRAVRDSLGNTPRIQMDGGVSPSTAPACLEAGVDVLVAASAIFSRPTDERGGVIASLRGGV